MNHALRLVSWIRANDRAIIKAPPVDKHEVVTCIGARVAITIESWLQSRMFARTAFSVIVIDDQGPRLTPRFESFGNSWNGVRWGLVGGMIVVECDIDIPAFIVSCSDYYHIV